MPNYCSNHLTITGEKEDLVRFMNFVRTEFSEETNGMLLLDFNTVCPMPRDPVDQLKGAEGTFLFVPEVDKSLFEKYQRLRKSENPKEQEEADGLLREAWYFWRVQNWGTKWNSCECEIDVSRLSQGEVVYDFWTAWAPPDGAVKAAALKFPELVFKLEFAEPGCNFSGVMTAHGEEVVIEDHNDVRATEYGQALFGEDE